MCSYINHVLRDFLKIYHFLEAKRKRNDPVFISFLIPKVILVTSVSLLFSREKVSFF